MTDPCNIAAGIVGAVDWQSEFSGFCRCPGESLHTHQTGRKDCRFNVDGAPTIHCFHASCAPAVAEANRSLRRATNQSPWQITLPGGRVLRNGDVLQSSGTVLPRELLAQGHHVQGRHVARTDDNEKLVLETLRVNAERFKPELFELLSVRASAGVATIEEDVSDADSSSCAL
jgi:hypothetical protein